MTARGSNGEAGRKATREHAVVIGASVSGLLAARALADGFERVTIIERDELPAVGEGRRAIPQGHHLHALLASGRNCLDELLPGLTEELVESGAVRCSALDETRQELAGHLLVREPVGIENILATRPLIEGHIRRRVLALPNVAVLERCEVRGLIGSPDRSRVEGVEVRERGEPVAERAIASDLVVAASGRSGQIPAWLERLGYPRPDEELLRIDLTYASRKLRLRRGALDGAKLVLVGPRPGRARGLGLVAQEGGHWLMTQFGYGDDRPPTDEDGYLEFVASAAPADVLEAVRDSEPLGEIVTHAFPANQRRRYERLKRFPAGLLATGDAICSFNPLYGQGMSVAALEAIELRRCLERGDAKLARRFFRAAAKAVDPAWELAIGGDLGLPEVAGHRPLGVRIGNAYVGRLLRAAEHDAVVAKAFARVGDLLEPSSHVMRPRILWRVLRGGRRQASTPSRRSRGRRRRAPARRSRAGRFGASNGQVEERSARR